MSRYWSSGTLSFFVAASIDGKKHAGCIIWIGYDLLCISRYLCYLNSEGMKLVIHCGCRLSFQHESVNKISHMTSESFTISFQLLSITSKRNEEKANINVKINYRCAISGCFRKTKSAGTWALFWLLYRQKKSGTLHNLIKQNPQIPPAYITDEVTSGWDNNAMKWAVAVGWLACRSDSVSYSWRSAGCGCIPRGWRTQRWRRWQPPLTGTSQTSSPTLLGCKALQYTHANIR